MILKLNYIKKLIRLLNTLVLIVICTLFVPSNVLAENWWYSKMQNPYLIGQGTLKIYFWNIYNLKLYSQSEIFNKSKNMVLEFEYLRKVSKQSVIDASIIELKKNLIDEKKLILWEKYLQKSIKDMSIGEKAALYFSPDKQITFFVEGETAITIKDKEFGNAYVDIWIGENTFKPKLRKKLLGKF